MMFLNPTAPSLHRKRSRDEEDEGPSGFPVGFIEHRSKRLQSLPVRTSPMSQRWNEQLNFPLLNPTYPTPAPRVVTPQEPVQEGMWADEPELVPAAAAMSDCDMDMMDTSEPVGQPASPPTGTAAGPFYAAANTAGRIPTPIQCSFAAQVRGHGWNGRAAMAGDVLATTPEEPTGARLGPGGMAGAPTAAAADWNSLAENRRLPSPISECGPEDSQGGMALDACSLTPSPPSYHGGNGDPLNQITHEHPLIAELPARTGSALSRRDSTPGTDRHGRSGSGASSNGGMDVEGMSPPRRGHTRSKHTLNSWTPLQPGMTRTFSIGYRADCEKCRNKQPGHFNHIIIS
ncbi:hypothetical protein VTJ83DRAFT_5344 [Remersonia thermophila]|uniref:Uncharacterized protein n=1 Tax=Remersonia thermophila TaxID=72144 RepID=A0ABR4D6T0_9PEZI